MRLYCGPTSPFARKVAVLISETGLTGIEQVIVTGSPLAPGDLPVAENPLGKIPALALDDGRTLFDSTVICQYLDDLAGAGLYGSGPARWDILTLEAAADGIMEAALLMVYESRLRPENLRFAPWVEAQWAKIARTLDMLENRWMPWLSQPLTMGQIATGCALGYLDLRHRDRGWREGRPALAAWWTGYSARPAMLATVPQT